MLGFAGVLIDGMSYGALLFLMAIGLSVTLGLMGFVNLSHTALAMVGGYFMVMLSQKAGLPFVPAVLIAVVLATVLGVALERGVYRLAYRRDALVQVLLTIGVMLMVSASMIYFFGPSLQMVEIPDALRGRMSLGPLDVSRYRLMLLVVSVILLIVLTIGFERTRFGTMVRAAVDNQRVAAALGIPIQVVFMATFAIGTALAALGGALGVEALGLDPAFAMKHLIMALMVVVVGGAGSIGGTFIAAMVLAVFDIACKYYVPAIGSFAMYGLMLVFLLIRPQGLRRAGGAK
ncbi:branched-chain amino acid ABC transporter permease [Variovorax sp. VNK109]|uniref:branched-chain amino acid ABC transporter permease n=1 Tax=Variovorax sp. VNK109 TaxID=3400919 RepID=UPI003C0BE7B5